MSNVPYLKQSPAQRLGITPADTKQADEIERMLDEAFGCSAFDRDGELVMLLLILVAQLRRRVDALEQENGQRMGFR